MKNKFMSNVTHFEPFRYSSVKFVFTFAAAALSIGLTATVDAQTTFTNSTPIVVNDSVGGNPGIATPYPSAITVNGLSGTVTDVNVQLNGLTGTFPDDIGLLLVAPNGARLVIQSDVGGGQDVSNVTYTLDDQATAGIPNAGPLVAGTFRPSSVGDDELFPITGPNPPPVDCQPAGECPQPAPAGTATLNGTFGAIMPNGDWRLYAVDIAPGDVHTYTGGWSIIITTSGPTVAADANVDFNGDGRTDYVVTRVTNTPFSDGLTAINRGVGSVRERMRKNREEPANLSPSATQIFWYTSLNTSGTTSVVPFGDAGEIDSLVPEDYDGDGRDDIAVWRPGAPFNSFFYILQSQSNTVRIDQFGQDGDNPTVVGDYDGDGLADPAVYRCPPLGTGDGQCFYFIRFSLGPVGISAMPWGFGEEDDFFPSPGDFDGDGRFDFCIQRTRPGTTSGGQFVLRRSMDGGVEFIDWGNDSDFILPGDYDGDGRADFCVRRTINNQRFHFILERDGGGTGTAAIPWGIIGDISTPGDYDGDGRTDIAIWRGNIDSSQNFFFIRRSSDSALQTFEWGQCPTGPTCDFPAANWNVQ